MNEAEVRLVDQHRRAHRVAGALARQLGAELPVSVRTIYLGAHAIPPGEAEAAPQERIPQDAGEGFSTLAGPVRDDKPAGDGDSPGAHLKEARQ